MTTKEEKTINELKDLMISIKNENQNYRNQISEKVKKLEEKIEEKYLPINLETSIIKSIQFSINKAIETSLTGYNSSLSLLIGEVINKHKKQISEILESSLLETIKTENFNNSIKEAFFHKLGRKLLYCVEGKLDIISNELKDDQIFKSKLIVVISNFIEKEYKRI